MWHILWNYEQKSEIFEIKSFLHATDNQSLSEPRMAKAEPLYDLLNEKIQQFGIAHDDLSIDESLVPYYGRHSCNQFIRAKPIRFRYKLWVLASATGVPYKIEIYQGRRNQGSDDPLDTRVVKNAFEIFKNPKDQCLFRQLLFKLFIDMWPRNQGIQGNWHNEKW